MQTAVGSLLKEELAEVGGWDKVIGLRVEGVRTALVRAIPLALVETGLAVVATSLFSYAQRATFGTIDTLIIDIDGFFANLTAMNVYFIHKLIIVSTQER